MKKKIMLGTLFVITLTSASVLSANNPYEKGTSYQSYSITAPAANGHAFSGQQTKARDNASGDVNSSSIGANYTLDMREYGAQGGSGAWVQKVDDNDSRSLPNAIDDGQAAALETSTDAFTPVDVNAVGTWRSN